jgi:hypothetical protein
MANLTRLDLAVKRTLAAERSLRPADRTQKPLTGPGGDVSHPSARPSLFERDDVGETARA